MIKNPNAKINTPKFQILISENKWTAKDFYNRWTGKYQFTILYSSFMELINNHVSWKLVYAFSISEMLEVDINDLFEFSTYEIQ
jgi:hypothetical protein